MLCVEQSPGPQTEAGVPTVAVSLLFKIGGEANYKLKAAREISFTKGQALNTLGWASNKNQDPQQV